MSKYAQDKIKEWFDIYQVIKSDVIQKRITFRDVLQDRVEHIAFEVEDEINRIVKTKKARTFIFG
jgi:DNA recombination-dependent growth factor C